MSRANIKSVLYDKLMDAKRAEHISSLMQFPNFPPIPVGKIIQRELDYNGITQAQLAREIGYSYDGVKKIMRGERNLPIEYAMLIGDVLDINPVKLMSYNDEYKMRLILREAELARGNERNRRNKANRT